MITILCKKSAFFIKNQYNDQIFAYLSFVLSQNAIFLAKNICLGRRTDLLFNVPLVFLVILVGVDVLGRQVLERARVEERRAVHGSEESRHNNEKARTKKVSALCRRRVARWYICTKMYQKANFGTFCNSLEYRVLLMW
jgi:hypothetical protein